MIAVTVIQTFDGKQHINLVAAQKHLDKLYVDALNAMAFAVLREVDKQPLGLRHHGIIEYVDTHMECFADLAKIKADMRYDIFKDDE